ncbi:MAG: hypothetical protein NTV09_12620 [Bacteroidetes bacterium]|nr:hypothetical protein [Bacteroidota bacterium]
MNEILIRNPMQKKNNRLKHRTRQRQRLSRKTILILTASSIACMSIALTIFLNTSRVEKSMAAVSVYVVPDEKPVVEMTLDAPVIRQLPVIGPNTILVKALKAEQHAAQEQHN